MFSSRFMTSQSLPGPRRGVGSWAHRVAALLALLTLLTSGGCTAEFWFGPAASTFAPHVDWLYMFIFWVSVFFFALILVGVVIFPLMYRRRPDGPQAGTETHSTELEIAWSVIPSIIVVMIFYWGFVGFLDMRQPPTGQVYHIKAIAYQWGWEFEYTDEEGTPQSDYGRGLFLPADRPTLVTLAAKDVMHSFYIAAFRAKMDCIPGRDNRLWFQPTQTGTYDLQCTEYCGKNHSLMNAKVYVLDAGEFRRKIEELQKPDPSKTPEQRGKELYEGKGCKGCHSVDGGANTGPTWKGLWGKPRNYTTTDGKAGTVVADADYIKESIVNPGAKIVTGYGNAMPSYAGMKDWQLNDLVAYIKSLE